MPKIIINEFKGINATQASLQLKPGEIERTQNLRARPYFNLARRKGVAFVSSQDEPINGIFELDLDSIIIPIVQVGGSLVLFPELSTDDGSFETPDPYPLDDPLDPDGGSIVLFLIEPTMRACQERRAFLISQGLPEGTFAFPNLIFNSDGTQINGDDGVSVGDYPVNNVYGPDLSYHDQYYGNPAGTRAAELINSIRDCIEDPVYTSFLRVIEGESSPISYDSGTIGFPVAATPATYATTLSLLKEVVRLMNEFDSNRYSVEEIPRDASNRTGSGFSAGGSCDDAKTEAITEYNAASWSPEAPVFQFRISTESFDGDPDDDYSVSITGAMGFFYTTIADFVGDVQFYLKCSDSLETAYLSPTAADNLYHFYEDLAVAESLQSSTISAPLPLLLSDVPGSCPLEPDSDEIGWQITSGRFILNPTWTYNV